MDEVAVEAMELDLLVEAIYRRYGYDFRQYAHASLKRRVVGYLAQVEASNIGALIPLVLRDESVFQGLLFHISVTVSEMFRDPWFFRALSEQALPFLSTFPFINIWQAGCATGEEVYSLAIMLTEAGLYPRARIYATDINTAALQRARARIYPLARIKDYSHNYQQAGGRGSFSDYYLAQYDSAIFDPALLQNVTFAAHNLATDSVFGEMHLILCRNVLIYFNRTLQDRVLLLLRDSLHRKGFLCLGSRETLDYSSVQADFTCLAADARIYQHRSGASAPGAPLRPEAD